jgi:hypothetical protein
VGAPLGLQTSSLKDHIRQGETRQVLAHMVAHVRPHREENTLSLVVAGAVAVRLAKVTGHDGPVDRCDNFGQGDVVSVAREHVTTSDSTF